MAQAVCGDVGCLVQATLPLAIGVRLDLPADSSPAPASSVRSVVLLPGAYSPATPALDGTAATLVLASVLGDNLRFASAQRDAGFELFGSATNDTDVTVAVRNSTTVVGYTGALYTGDALVAVAGGATGQIGFRSLFAAPNTFAIASTSTGTRSLQIWDAVPDSYALGLGEITLQISSVGAGSTAVASSYCQRGAWRNATSGQCQGCNAACTTCYDATASTCLSCAANERLVNGRCQLANCSGGAATASGLGACLEAFVDYSGTGTASSTPSTTASKEGPSALVIAAVAVSGVAGLVLLALGVRCLCRRRRRRRSRDLDAERRRVHEADDWAARQRYAIEAKLRAPAPVRTEPGVRPPVAYPHFGTDPHHRAYEKQHQRPRPPSATGSAATSEVERPPLRPLTVLGIPRVTVPRRKKRKRRHHHHHRADEDEARPDRREPAQSGWLRRLTGQFETMNPWEPRLPAIPPVPRIPSTVADLPAAKSAAPVDPREPPPTVAPRKLVKEAPAPIKAVAPPSTQLVAPPVKSVVAEPARPRRDPALSLDLSTVREESFVDMARDSLLGTVPPTTVPAAKPSPVIVAPPRPVAAKPIVARPPPAVAPRKKWKDDWTAYDSRPVHRPALPASPAPPVPRAPPHARPRTPIADLHHQRHPFAATPPAAREEPPLLEEDQLSERRVKVATRLANWLTETADPPRVDAVDEEELRSEASDASDLSDWDARRVGRSASSRRPGW